MTEPHPTAPDSERQRAPEDAGRSAPLREFAQFVLDWAIDCANAAGGPDEFPNELFGFGDLAERAQAVLAAATPPASAEPRTATGRALLRKLRLGEAWIPAMLAIEAEASAHADAQTSLARLDLAEAQAATPPASAERLEDRVETMAKLIHDGFEDVRTHPEGDWPCDKADVHRRTALYVVAGMSTPPASAERDAVVEAACAWIDSSPGEPVSAVSRHLWDAVDALRAAEARDE